MADSTRAQIEQAYNLIQKEQLDQAIAILRQVVTKEPKNVDAWWLMANAVSEPANAYEALSKVLQLAPNHVEARAAYDQLVQEFPELVPKKPAAAPQESGDFSSDISVDIDDLLRRTGALDSRRSEPLKRPEDAADVSDAYLDQAWGNRPPEPAQQPESLDDLFGGSEATNVSATPTEDEDLAALFTGQPAPAPRQKPEAALDDFFGGSETAPQADAGPDDLNLDDFFGDAADEAAVSPEADLESMFGEAPGEAPEPIAAEPQQDLNLDEFFAPAPATTKQPAASGGLYESDPFAGKEPAFVGDMEPAAPTAKVAKPRKERPPKSAPVVVKEAPPPDPFAVEHRANRRSRVRIVLGALILIALLAGGVFLYLQLTKPDAVTVAVQETAKDLTGSGFAEVATRLSGDMIQVTVCGVVGPGLQAKVYQAMDLIAARLVNPDVRKTVNSAQIEVTTCGKPDVKLYRASATMGVLAGYIETGKTDTRAYHAGWQRN
jgi:tetratricopeptide (TPR) repeat protein